jgi:predicted CoA-binding protein
MDVVILGASSNPTRYAYKAAQRLLAAGHHVTGVNPALPPVPGVRVVKSIEELPPDQHTLTVYLASQKSSALEDAIVGHGFARVIFNPGAENQRLAQRLRAGNVEVLEACTLVLLASGQF